MVPKTRILKSLVLRVTVILVGLVAVCIATISGLGYRELSRATEENAAIRIDRAARAASALLAEAHTGAFTVERNDDGKPERIRLAPDVAPSILTYSDDHDALLKEIGAINQGAANLFRYNPDTLAFDRFATTFRKPDGSLPPSMSISNGHPAYNALSRGAPFTGEVPVMGRMRLAYLTPIVTAHNSVAGALAVDVGWADDLHWAKQELREQTIGTAAAILLLVTALGILIMRREMAPLRTMASYANALAAGQNPGEMPFLRRDDEVGNLAQGLSRVIDLQSKLEQLAYTDTITTCGNRTRYLRDLETATDKARAFGAQTAVIHLDINGFSKVNNAFGQSAGDKVLQETSRRLLEVFGNKARISRLSGDDFCILCAFTDTAAEPARLIQLAITSLSAPINLPEAEIHVDPSFGVSLIPQDAPDPETAHRTAGLALRAAKESVRPGFAFFSEQLNAKARRELKLEGELRDALKSKQLRVHYQPQVCLKRMCLKGFEALVRWPKDSAGFISPSEFIPIAEKTGLVIELGAWVLDESCRQARAWIDSGMAFDYVSVNVSPIQIWQPNFEQIVRSTLQKHDLPAHYLCLEVTENVFVGHGETRVTEVLRTLRELGILLALDDFGSGYSSLSYLNRLPFGQLKIDQAFVAGANRDKNKEKVLRGMVTLAQTLGLKVIAEGAEDAGEVALVRQIGCDGVQGYYFGRPVAAGEVPAVVAGIADNAPAFRTCRLQDSA